MTRFDGRLRVPHGDDDGISVVADVTDETLRLTAVNGSLGAWPRHQIRINARDDGFHIRLEGEEVILSVDQDAEFAVAMGVRSAPPLLRRKIAALMRTETERT